MNAPVVPVIANVMASPLIDPVAIKNALVTQVTGTVRWRECVAYMAQNGVNAFVEAGAGKVLTGLAKKNAPEAVAINAGTPDEIAALVAILKG